MLIGCIGKWRETESWKPVHSYGDRRKCDLKKMTVGRLEIMAISEAERFRSAH